MWYSVILLGVMLGMHLTGCYAGCILLGVMLDAVCLQYNYMHGLPTTLTLSRLDIMQLYYDNLQLAVDWEVEGLHVHGMW